MSTSDDSEWQIEYNKDVISRLLKNDPELTSLEIAQPSNEAGGVQYFVQPNGDKELELLGRLVGSNTHLKELSLIGSQLFNDDPALSIIPFYTGLSNNKSITQITLNWFEGDQVMRSLHPFFKRNRNLAELNIHRCILGREGNKLLASAISKCIGSLSSLNIESNATDGGEGHSDEDLAIIVQALIFHPHLKRFRITGENIGTRTLSVLERLLRHHITELNTFDLHHNNFVNEVVSMSAVLTTVMKKKMIHTLKLRQWNGGLGIGQEGMDVLANTLPNSSLRHLDVSGNINRGSDGGVDALVVALPRSNLMSLNLSQVNFGESGVKALACALKADPCLEKLGLASGISAAGKVAIAEALANNSHLKEVDLSLSLESSDSDECWMAFSNTLCDTTTVNKTHLSNHTLEDIRQAQSFFLMIEDSRPQDVVSALELNQCADKQQVAMKKILKHHRHFDIQPFVQWEFKVLPLLIHWLERTAPFSAEFDMNGTIEMRKLLSYTNSFKRCQSYLSYLIPYKSLLS